MAYFKNRIASANALLFLVLAIFLSSFVFNLSSFAQTNYWKKHMISSEKGGPDGGALWDFNSDGKVDIVVPYEQKGKIILFISPSDPRVGAWYKIKIGDAIDPEEVEIGDINNDGNGDVIVGEEQGRGILVFVNPGNVTKKWDKYQVAQGQGFNSIRLVDIDRDGRLDIVAAQKTIPGRLSWYKNPGIKAIWQEYLIDSDPTMKGTHSVLVEDIDGDGDLDICAGARWSGHIKWYENRGTPQVSQSWISHIIQPQNGNNGFMWSVFADVNSDGLKDLFANMAFENSIYVYVRSRDGRGGFVWNRTLIANQEAPTGIGVADLNFNGKLDIVTGEDFQGRIHMYEQEQNGVWTRRLIYAPPGGVGKIDEVIFYDFDRDGDLDVFVQDQKSKPQSVYWLENPAR